MDESARPACSSSSLVDAAASAEGGVDQRGEGLDVGTHDDDVASLERRVLDQQMEDRVADHLDLPRPPVAGVDLETAIVVVQDRPRVLFVGKRSTGRPPVGPDVSLQMREKRATRVLNRMMLILMF